MEISNLQFITNQYSENTIIEQIQEACKASCKWIQLRLKNMPDKEIVKIAIEAQKICKYYNAVLIINDYAHLVKSTKVDGVHLGKNDMSPTQARKLLGNKYIIGATANSIDDVLNLYKQEVDYIGLGPFRFTSTKKNLSPILGIQGYRDVISVMKKKNIQTPIMAIGGIKVDDINNILDTGISGIAVSSVVANTDNIAKEFQSLKKQIEHYLATY